MVAVNLGKRRILSEQWERLHSRCGNEAESSRVDWGSQDGKEERVK